MHQVLYQPSCRPLHLHPSSASPHKPPPLPPDSIPQASSNSRSSSLGASLIVSSTRFSLRTRAKKMAHLKSLVMLLAIASASLLSVSGKLECEDLPVELCAFAVSSTGARCLLEKEIVHSGHLEYQCQTSIVTENQFSEWIETDDCVNSCGLERMSVGLSSDALVQNGFIKTLCSAECQENCPNVVDLYTKLAAGEGVSLTQVCEAERSESRRMMGEFSIFASKSANTLNAWELAAPAPSSSTLGSQNFGSVAPAPAPVKG